jgi:hypothetical protein
MDSSLFESLESLLICVFRHRQTPLLTLDRIADFLSTCDLRVPLAGRGIVAASAVPRRLLVNVLSNSEHFVRSGASHHQAWALRPNNPLFQCNKSIAAAIEQLLAKNGPMTLRDVLASADFAASSQDALEKVIEIHADEFRTLDDGRIWLVNAPVPAAAAFDTVRDAVEFGLAALGGEATIEELRRILCLGTVNGVPITRLDIAREVAARPDAFAMTQRGRYAMLGAEEVPQSEWEDGEKPFNAQTFFGATFCFAYE